MTVNDSHTHTCSTSFGTVTYLEAGEGRTLLYLHGVGDSGAMIPAIGRFAARRRVIRPDHPGFLRSSDNGAPSVRDLAEWYAEQLDAHALSGIDLVGCSLGGWLAAELTLLRPGHIRTLTLIDPAGLDDNGDMPNAFTLTPHETIKRSFATETFRAASPPSADVAALLARSWAAAKKIASDPYMHDPTLGERLSALLAPTSIVWGAQDGIIPVSVAECWRKALPNATITLIENAGHLPHVEQAEAFHAAVTHLEE